jgi:hypothetical protein
MNETFVGPCWNVTLLFVVMNRFHDLRTGITGYGSNFKYSLAIDGVKVFLYKLGFCGIHRLAGTVISLACVHIMFTVLRRPVDNQTYVKPILQWPGRKSC